MSKKKKPRPTPDTLELPLVGIDSHAHLDIDPLVQDLESYLDQARAAGVARMGNVFLGPDAYRSNKGLFADHPGVFFILGQHPNDALKGGDPAGLIEDMRACFQADPRIKALGEIGLDHYWDDAPHHVQEDLFRAQLGLARDLDLPVVIHCRDAWDATLLILDQEGFEGRALIWHCFGGGTDMARRILDRGWHISIPGPVTYRKNEPLVEAAASIPLDRLCLETDCPFLAPEPWRGKTNHPALMGFTAVRIAQAKDLTPAELWQACADTAERFFKLK